jgi:hypothetical protein
MSKIALTAAGVALAGATALATTSANAFWGSWGSGGPWYGGPWYGGPWYGGYPYYGGWGGYPYGGWGGYPYGGWGYPYGGYGYGYGYGYPSAVAPVAPVAVQPAASSAAK